MISCICLKSLFVFRIYPIIMQENVKTIGSWRLGAVRSECSGNLNGKQGLPEAEEGQDRVGQIGL